MSQIDRYQIDVSEPLLSELERSSGSDMTES